MNHLFYYKLYLPFNPSSSGLIVVTNEFVLNSSWKIRFNFDTCSVVNWLSTSSTTAAVQYQLAQQIKQHQDHLVVSAPSFFIFNFYRFRWFFCYLCFSNHWFHKFYLINFGGGGGGGISFLFLPSLGNLITILVSKVSSPSEEFGNKPKIRGILTAIAKQLQNK
jgi:hypothetical protein